MSKVTLENMAEAAAQEAQAAPVPPGRTRNYKQMKDDKLRSCEVELAAGEGDAWDRCMNGGSGDPDADLELVTRLLQERGLA